MNKEVKEKWIKALRSGEYQQGKGFLCRIKDDNEKKYCCLGVLCDLAVKEGVIPEPNIYYNLSYLYNKNGEEILPQSVCDWAEISNLGHYSNIDYNNLAVDNDSGKTFGEIADLIEKNF